MPLDQDGAGLMSDLEAELGTDPFSADTDGDGCRRRKYSIGTDPTDLSDRPYVGNGLWTSVLTRSGRDTRLRNRRRLQLQDQYDLVRMYDSVTIRSCWSSLPFIRRLPHKAPELEA